jgi:phospholipid/cholesterol/gamma-HCH transport system permease protein
VAFGRLLAAAGLSELGDIGALTVATLRAAIRPPYPYGREFVRQFLLSLRLCLPALVIVSVALTYGPAGVQAANFLSLFGSLDRLGGLFVVIVIREFAPLVCAIVVAGVAGTAITADLGARQVREELDALVVLGVDPVKNLVVPRFLALVLLTAFLDIFALIFGTVGGVLITLQHHAPLGPFWASYFDNATATELAGSLIKAIGYGAIIAVVCCYKGLTVSGGSGGVGRAVNRAVVISFLGVGIFNYVFTQTLLATHPDLSIVR